MSRSNTLLTVAVLMIAILVMSAAPALAAPTTPDAAQPGLHKAHCATMGTAGHIKVPYACPMPHEGCAGMTVE